MATFTSVLCAQVGERLKHNADAYLMDLGFTEPWTAFERNTIQNQADYITVHLDKEHWKAPDDANPWGSLDRRYQNLTSRISWAKNRGIKINLHSLISPQVTPNWITNGPWTGEELDNIMEAWISDIASAFGNDLYSVIVVNEAIEGDRWSEKAAPKMLENKMGKTAGHPNYIRRAFELSRYYMPGVKRIYNDYNHEDRGPKSNKVFTLCRHLKNYGNKPDVIGFQSHFTLRDNNRLTFLGGNTTELNLETWRSNMRRYANQGIESFITELDIGIPNTNAQDWEYEQAKHMSYIAAMAAADPNCNAMTLWKLRDGSDSGWRTNERACLYTYDGAPKYAFYGVQLGLIGVMVDETYRLSDDWTNKYVIVGSGDEGTNVVTHSSNPNWTYGKWVVRLGANANMEPNGRIRLENLGNPNMFLDATYDTHRPIKLTQSHLGSSQNWLLKRSTTAWDRITLKNQMTATQMNATGQWDGAWLTTHGANNLPRQNFEFILDTN